MKVRLIFAKSYLDIPTWKDTFKKDIEVELPQGIDQAHLISARCYSTAPSPAQVIGGDINAAIVEYKDDQNLVGKLLTYIDATFTDVEQRKAHKDIVKGIVYGWAQDIRTRAVQTVDSHSGSKASSRE